MVCNRNYRLITNALGSSYFPQPLLTLQRHAAHSHTHAPTHIWTQIQNEKLRCVLCKIYKRIHTLAYGKRELARHPLLSNDFPLKTTQPVFSIAYRSHTTFWVPFSHLPCTCSTPQQLQQHIIALWTYFMKPRSSSKSPINAPNNDIFIYLCCLLFCNNLFSIFVSLFFYSFTSFLEINVTACQNDKIPLYQIR